MNIKTGSTYKYNPIVEEYGTLSKKFSFLEWVRYNYKKDPAVSKKNLDDGSVVRTKSNSRSDNRKTDR